jgi:acetyl esterase/lipase
MVPISRFVAGGLSWLLLVCLAQAQELVGYRPTGILPAAEFQERYDEAFKHVERPTIQPVDVRLYRVSYNSKASNEGKTPLSGLVAIPTGGAPKGLVVYYHGTTAERNNVPSRYRGGKFPEEAHWTVLAFAAAGYAVAAPDYLGLGDHLGFHPYALANLNSWSGIDLIEPARKIAAEVEHPIGPELFVTGYSEGGACAMWAGIHLAPTTNPLYRISKLAPISGPYDLSDTQSKSMLARQSNLRWLGARVYFAAYTARGMQEYVPGIELKDYFTPSFASYIPFVFGQDLRERKLIEKLVGKALQLGLFQNLDKILKLEFRERLAKRDPSDPFVAQLIANDCYDWSPPFQTYLFAVEDDFLVPKEHALKAIRTMRQRGVGPDLARCYILPGRKFDHLQSVWPGLINARKFFDGGFDAVPSTEPK